MSETPEAGPTEPQDAPPLAPRAINLAVVAGVIVLIGLVAFAIFRQRQHAPSGAAAEDAAAAGGAGEPGGTAITAATITLTPEARIAAERYRCVCGCNDPLNVCTCTRTPGSIDMKKAVQELVDQKKMPAEIDQAMVARYGEAVLLSNPAPPRTSVP
jgi:cytochrome c-type biogenesis protein CcmH/NrfF